VQTLGGSGSGSNLAPGDVQWAVLDERSTLPDAIVVSSGSNSVLVYRTTAINNGVLAFAPAPQTLFVGTDPASVTVADLNDDGVPDLVVSNQGSNDVSVIFGSYDALGDWIGTLGPRLKSGGDGPIAVVARDLSGNGIPDLAVINGGSGTVTELPGVGRGFFDDRAPRTLFNLGSGLVQPPTFAGSGGLGYGVTAGGDLVRFDLLNPANGASVAFSGAQVVAAQALSNGQVVVALADGAVDLLRPAGNNLSVASVLQAQGGVPALPSSIEVVSKPSGQFNVVVSSQGSDTLFVYSQGAIAESGGSPSVNVPSPQGFNAPQASAAAAATQGFTLTTSTVATSASSASASTSASTSSSSASVAAVTTSASIGLSLGGFSSLGNSSTRGSSGTVLVPVEGNTYLSVPILDFGLGEGDENGAGEGRMPWLSSKFNFGDTSSLTRFVIGLDEALQQYRGADEMPPENGPGVPQDPWRDDLFHLHVPAPKASPGGAGDNPQSMVPEPQAPPPRVRAGFKDEGGKRPALSSWQPTTESGARFIASAGLIFAMLQRPGLFRLAARRSWRPGQPVAASAWIPRRSRKLSPISESKE
jgi:hypothetical protein